VAKFTLGEQRGASILLLAAQEDFAQDVRRLQFVGLGFRLN
jgi:adenylate cyclase